ncbi:unnamed protein product [Candidula unifasciata]|uniref:Uncharacterized protein n=1 Tax=Candidula unifasciata TaxID=100452 RepID=A0A8S3YW41_9EUPU|nr:unnamed protein product [Candidula unifasciata]
MADTMSESASPHKHGDRQWRQSLRSASQERDKQANHIDGQDFRSRTPSPSLSKNADTNGTPLKLTKKRVTIANALRKSTGNMSGKLDKSAVDLTFIEAEYIKSLQRQIYFLELETNYLREQARKATEMHPQMVREADNMLTQLREMQAEIDQKNLEIKQKDSQINIHTSEKERIAELIHLEQENRRREKTLLTEELVTMKKEKDRLERELARKNQEILDVKNELDRSALELNNAEMKINTLKAQLEQRIEQHNMTMAALDEKRTQLLSTKAQLRELEEKFISSTITVKDKLNEDLRNELRLLHQRLTETELEVERDRFLRDKVADDIARIVRENSALTQQLTELTKQLEREKELRDSTTQRHSRSLGEISTLKEELAENEVLRNRLMQEREMSRQYLEQLKAEEAASKDYKLQINAMKKHALELDGMENTANIENSQLRKEKILLVDHVAELQRKLEEKDREILSLMATADDMEARLRSLDLRKSLELTQHSQKWEQFSNLADSMKSLAKSMTAQTTHNSQSLSQMTSQF